MLSKIELKKQLLSLGIRVKGNYVRKSDIEAAIDYNYAKDAARYMWFIVKGDGTIWEGIEDPNDAKTSLKELKETDKDAKIISRSKIDKEKLAEFFKNNKVPKHMIDKGLREAKKSIKMGN